MAKEWTEEEISKAVKEVISQAANNAELRSLALKDPCAAIKKVTGDDVPEGLSVNMIDAGDSLHANLEFLNIALSDSDLDQVSGGGGCGAISGRCPCGRGNVMVVR